MNAPYQQKLAHLATVPGGSRKGSNTFLRSARQRRKMFEKKMEAMTYAAAQKFNAATPKDMPPAALAELVKAIEDLRFKLCGV